MRFLRNASIALDEEGSPIVRSVVPGEDGVLDPDRLRQAFPPGSRQDIAVVLRSKHIGHYFHFLELITMLFAIKKEFFFDCRIARILVGSQCWNNPHQNNAQKCVLDCLYPEAQIVEWFDGASIEADNVLVLDCDLAVSSINKFLEPGLALCVKWGPAFRQAVCEALDIQHERRDPSLARPLAIYVARTPPRCLLPELQAAALAEARKTYRVMPVDFAHAAWREQVKLAARADVMIAVHGNGLSNLLWLPPWSVVIEMFPEGVHHYDYQIFSEIAGLEYFGIEGDALYRQFGRYGAPRGNHHEADRPVTRFSWDAFSLALQAGLPRSILRASSGNGVD